MSRGKKRYVENIDPDIKREREDRRCYIENELQYLDPIMYEHIKECEAGGRELRLAKIKEESANKKREEDEEREKTKRENDEAERLYNSIVQPIDLIQQIGREREEKNKIKDEKKGKGLK